MGEKRLSIEEFCNWARFRHDVECNQKYDGNLPYSKHLEYVYAQALYFKHLLTRDEFEKATLGCFGHDLIEDARVTYNDIKQKVGIDVAEIIFACTETRGRNRDERHGPEYYSLLAGNKVATFVKLCDIMANVKYSTLSNSSMYKKYKKEFQKLKNTLYREEFKEIFDTLQNIYNLHEN